MSGALIGAAFLHPGLAAGAWLGIGLLAWALSQSQRRLEAALACLLVSNLIYVVGFPWTPWMFAILFGDDPLQSWGYAAALAALSGSPVGIALGLAATVGGRWVGARFWLPPAWAAAEIVRLEVTHISTTDWLATQWAVPPVVRAVGHLGWWPSLLLCLFLAASVGQALAERRWRLAAVVAPGALLLLALPPLDPGDPAALEGVGVVHTRSTLDLPHRAAGGEPLSLVVWPESALDLRPQLAEGPAPGVQLPPLLPGSEAEHLLGLITTLPMVGRHNQVVRVDRAGRIVESRAKQILFPTTEARFLGVGTDRFREGRRPPLLTVAGRRVIPAICGEYLDRGLVAEGRRLGGELLTISARDQMMPGDIALRQLLAVQVLRSAEFGVPSVRSSLGGWSTVVGADGDVLAVSRTRRNHLLRWSGAEGITRTDYLGRVFDEGDVPEPMPPPRVAVLYSERAPHLRPRCPEGACRYFALEGFACPGAQADTVIVAGHATPPDYLSHSPAQIAAAVRCFSPDLVVVDACYSASSPLLAALSPLDALFVGFSGLVPEGGFHYGSELFGPAPAWDRARAVALPGFPELTRMPLDASALDAIVDTVEQMEGSALQARLVRRSPPLVAVDRPTGGAVLVPVAWERLRGHRPRRER